VQLDVDNLIDYNLINFYGGNLDAALSNFLGNSSPNNIFMIRNRNGDEGWKFIQHDAEHTMRNVGEDRTGPYYCRRCAAGEQKQSAVDLRNPGAESGIPPGGGGPDAQVMFNDGVLARRGS